MNNTDKIKVGIIGATGYAGAELVRLLLNHPMAEISAVSSVSFEGKPISEVYPSLKNIFDMKLEEADAVINASDIVFASLPHGLSEEIAAKCAAAAPVSGNLFGKKYSRVVFVDLGADFRLHDEADYNEWYGKSYTVPELHSEAVYSLPELYREQTKNADIIGNPGCYPTSIALGLMPALKNKLVEPDGIVIDSKSGVTGAGRGLTQNTHYPDTNEAFSAYKAACHRHTPEIEQTLSEIAGKALKVTFVPHLLPVNRGIESTIYVKMKDGADFEAVRKAYEKAYENERFVRLEKDGAYANIKNVRYSNYCDISLHFDKRTGTLIVSSVIDNMVKGAAGQAIQNMNIRFGIDEAAGLLSVPPSF